MKKSEIAQKYPHTWAVYKNYRPYCRQSFYNKCINLFKYPNLPFEDIQEPTWIICEKYLTQPKCFEEKESHSTLSDDIIDVDTHNVVATISGRERHLAYSYRGNMSTEDRLFSVCYEKVKDDLFNARIFELNVEQDNLRQEILNSYTKED